MAKTSTRRRSSAASLSPASDSSSKEAILAFINVCEEGGGEEEGSSALPEQERLCRLILDELVACQKKSQKKSSYYANDDTDFIRTSLYKNKNSNSNTKTTTTTTVRSILGNLPSVSINQLATCLSDMIAHRIVPPMPATQDDEEANQERIITVSRHAFTAAQLYVTLLSMPGSFGAGLVHVSALSNLSALVRRWCVESSISNNNSNNNKVTAAANNAKKGKRKTSTQNTRAKRSRRHHHNDSDSDGDDDDSNNDENRENFAIAAAADEATISTTEGIITNQETLCRYGCQLARAMAQIPSQLDFLHWSDDATEVVLDAVVCAQMTAAALSSNSSVDSLKESLVTCAKHLAQSNSSSNDDDDDDDEVNHSTTTIKNRNTLVFILRGIFSVLCMTIEVPQGQKGKEAAHAAAASTLERMVAVLSKEEITRCANVATIASQQHTPNRKASRPFASPAIMTTGRKNRRKRVSFGSGRITAPLRKTPTKLRTPSSNNNAQQQHHLQSVLVGMLQKLITRPDLDRSDKRKHATGVVLTCLAKLNATEQGRMVRFLIPTCHSKVSVHRLAGVELLSKVLSSTWLWKYHHHHALDDNAMKSPTAKSPMTSLVEMSNLPSALLGCLVGRLSDKAPAVRARAATGLVELLDSSVLVYESLQPFLDTLQSQLAQRALHDDKATVRKAAIVAISKLVVYIHVYGNDMLHDDDDDKKHAFQLRTTDVLSHLCGTDPSVAARKAAADGLTNQLLQCNSNTASNNKATPLEHAWTMSVLPLVLDAEPTCVNLAVDLFAQVVVSPLIGGDDSERAWRILGCVSDCTERQGATMGEYEALRTAVRMLSDDLCSSLLQRLRNEALCDDGQNLSAVWCLLQALTDQPKELPVFVRWMKRKSVGHGFLTEPLTRLLQLCRGTDDGSLTAALRCCLRVIGKSAGYIPVDEATTIVTSLKDILGQQCLGPEVISAAVTVLIECLRRSVPASELRTACASLVDELYTKCEDELSRILEALGRGATNDGNTALPRAIFLCGELTMIGFRSDEDGSKTKNTDTCDPIIGLTPKPSPHLLNMIQVLLPKMLPGNSVVTPESARAHAFVTLGKLCLRDERFAKKCLNLFARELHQNLAEPCLAVQSNALLVLGDLCIKYTNLVDRHLPVMAACLQAGTTTGGNDRNFLAGASKSSATALVRKHAILMLSGLLLQDYIKWRGLLFHRFLVASSDTDEGVAALAEMTLCGPLLGKNSKLFFNNFVESLFILNRCTAHPIYMAATCGGGGAGDAVGFEGIDLSGDTGRARRYQMYKMMLSNMCDEEKIGVAARLAKDILGAAVQSEGNLGRVCRAPSGKLNNDDEASAFAVLSDAFFVLTSPWLRVGRATSSAATTDEDEIPATSGKSEQVAAAKGRLLSKISRKHLVEIILPILCNLKGILQASCSPLLKDLMQYLSEMFRAYKVEVKEFLANDPTLLQEVEYDAKKYSRKDESSPGRSRTSISK